MDKVKKLVTKSKNIIASEGGVAFTKRATKYLYYKKFPDKKKQEFKDILVINGCGLPHPARYRVDHQIEQLLSSGITADSVFYEQLDISRLKYYQSFIFFRCPITDTIRDFIKQAHHFNKVCFFDIDDLVIDTKYTDKIDFVASMSKDEKNLYDDGVNRMRQTLELCDYGITTTKTLQKELSHYVDEVFVNRNTASDEMVALSLKALETVSKDSSKITLGYFSGSITHNKDFEMIMPALIRVLKKYPNVHLKVAGILDIPEELQPFIDRIEATGFMDWRELPAAIAGCDINLAPLTTSLFNQAKSENKWTEAALVKVPTLASNMGAFKDVIVNKETGLLAADQDWESQLAYLIENTEDRQKIGKNSHEKVLEDHTTVGTSQNLAKFIRSKMKPSIAFVLPTTDISGGVNVIMKHAEILQKNGWNVTLFDNIDSKIFKESVSKYNYRVEIPGYNIVPMFRVNAVAYFDAMVATLWTTVQTVKEYPNVKRRMYLVQSHETGFSPWGSGQGRFNANATYSDATGLEYITISLWCKEWLKSKYEKTAKYAPNGIDGRIYPYRERDFTASKIHILIEGDSHSVHKNTDEAFRVVEKLDPEKYHISYLSYYKEPKPWYRVDKFYNRIDPAKVGEIYAKCDILIKTSLLESFSYPPLEMITTGGFAVVIPNGGNAEYLKDGENCLMFNSGDIDLAVQHVEQIVSDKSLRTKLLANGKKTAASYEWGGVEKDIVRLYK